MACFRHDGYTVDTGAEQVPAHGYEHTWRLLRELDVPYHLTRTWTTDAIYRETRDNMLKRKEEGCRVVEMECASTAAVAMYRGVEFYQYLYGADSLAGDEWDPRDLVEGHDEAGGAIVDLAFRIAERLV